MLSLRFRKLTTFFELCEVNLCVQLHAVTQEHIHWKCCEKNGSRPEATLFCAISECMELLHLANALLFVALLKGAKQRSIW